MSRLISISNQASTHHQDANPISPNTVNSNIVTIYADPLAMLTKTIHKGAQDAMYPVDFSIPITYQISFETGTQFNVSDYIALTIQDSFFLSQTAEENFIRSNFMVQINDNSPFEVIPINDVIYLPQSMLTPLLSNALNTILISTTVTYLSPTTTPTAFSLPASCILHAHDPSYSIPFRVFLIGSATIHEGILLIENTVSSNNTYTSLNENVTYTFSLSNTATASERILTILPGDFTSLLPNSLSFYEWLEPFPMGIECIDQLITNTETLTIQPNTSLIIRFVATYVGTS